MPAPISSEAIGRPLVIAVDGPSGSGKSSVSREVARRLGLEYLDTGAMYRAATLAVLRAEISLQDTLAVIETVEKADIAISTDPRSPGVTLDGADVSGPIRSSEVTAAVSAVSAVPAVRVRLVDLQRELIGDGGVVVEGRDIGSVVWPGARPKIYLTASAETRARRRAGELGASADLAAVAADIDRRDRLDSSRAASPLARAEDAIEVDTTHLGIDQVVQRLVDITMNGAGR